MWLCVCDMPPIMMKHSTAWKIQFPECKCLTIFSCVMTILTSWKGLCGYDRDDMSCQDFCTVCLLRTFPSHYSICKQHVVPAVQYLHVVFSCFLIFCDVITNWEYYCVSAIIFCGSQTPPVPFNHSLLVVVHLPKQYMVFEDCGQWVSRCWKSTTLLLFLMHLYSSTSDAEPRKAYWWRGAPVPCVCWYMYLQTSSQENIVSRRHTLPMSVWYDFHWHHLIRNKCMKPSVVVMQKSVPLCCDLYQMHHVCTCRLATGDTVCWS